MFFKRVTEEAMKQATYEIIKMSFTKFKEKMEDWEADNMPLTYHNLYVAIDDIINKVDK